MSADLALAADPSVVERAADPGEFIIQSCERAKTWLREALEHGDIDSIAECKSQAEAIRVYTMSKQLGKDAQLSATEIVRRAERGIGVALRRAQEAGEVRRAGDHTGNQYGNGIVHPVDNSKPPVTDFAKKSELYGSGPGKPGIFGLTDGIPDEDFEAALAEARAEGKLTRANIARKAQRQKSQPADAPWIPAADDHTTEAALRRRDLIREMAAEGYSSRQISDHIGTLDSTIRRIAREIGVEIPADAVISGTRRHDSNRIVRETVAALEGVAMGAQLVEPGDLDPAQIADWASSLTDSIRVLNRLIKTMKEYAQ